MNLSPNLLEQAHQAFDAIKKARSILLHLHPVPDGDSIGSALAMYHALKSIDKNVTVIQGDTPLAREFELLPGYSEILRKNYFEIELSQYDLFIIQDSSSAEFISLKQKVVFPPHLNTVVIDHHATNQGYGNINIVDPSSPATAQIIFNLLRLWNISLSEEIGLCLYVGIYTDTGGFQYAGVSQETFMIASELFGIAPALGRPLQYILNNKPYEQIRYIGVALSHVKLYLNGKIAVTTVSNKELIENGISKEYTRVNELNSLLRSIRGVEISIATTEIKPHVVKLSLRSVDGERYDVSKVAIALGEGGGHKAATGITTKGNVDEVLQKIIKIITDLYPDLAE